METNSSTSSSHYHEPRKLPRNDETHHYEDIGKINLGSIELKSCENDAMIKNLSLGDCVRKTKDNVIYTTAQESPKCYCAHSGQSCIGVMRDGGSSRWLSIVLTVLIIFSSVSLILNILVISGAVAIPREQVTGPISQQVKAGPPGNQGPQGPQGKQGDTGVPGSKGIKGDKGERGLPGTAGVNGFNLTSCTFSRLRSTRVNAGSLAENDVSIVEPLDRRIVGVTCSSNNAAIAALVYDLKNNRNWYKCKCGGESRYLPLPPGDTSMFCYLNYWSCPLTN